MRGDEDSSMGPAEPQELTVHVHRAQLNRTCTSKRHALLYAIVKVNGLVVLQTPRDRKWGTEPWWETQASVDVTGECNLSISVWDANRFTRDVRCGSVALPCAPDMGCLRNREYTLTMRDQPVGTVSVTIAFGSSIGPTLFCKSEGGLSNVAPWSPTLSDRKHERAVCAVMTACSVASGGEIDHLIAWADDDSWSQGIVPPPLLEESESEEGTPFLSNRPLRCEHEKKVKVAKHIIGADCRLVTGDVVDGTVIFVQTAPPRPHLPTPPPSPRIGPNGTPRSLAAEAEVEAAVEAVPSGELAAVEAAPSREVGATRSQVLLASLYALLGTWRCTATKGLDGFLKRSGVSIFQRKLATAARWPSWEFKMAGGVLHFVNHSAVGDLREDIPLDGSVYTWKDGHGNNLSCTASWKADPDSGGLLRIERTGPLGAYEEFRRVTGDQLEFTLLSDKGGSWGRSFVRAVGTNPK